VDEENLKKFQPSYSAVFEKYKKDTKSIYLYESEMNS